MQKKLIQSKRDLELLNSVILSKSVNCSKKKVCISYKKYWFYFSQISFQNIIKDLDYLTL